MRSVSLTNSPRLAFVDDEDFLRVQAHVWHAWTPNAKRRLRKTYAAATINGKRAVMHRWLMGLDPRDPTVVDHIDHDGLNNCRSSNLRRCSTEQNSWNRRPLRAAAYIGVSVLRGAFIAKIANDYLGSFASEHRAALAYNREAMKRRGEFSVLNLIDQSALEADLSIEAGYLAAQIQQLELDRAFNAERRPR